MRPIAANANLLQHPAKTIGDVVSQRHCPSFFKTDHVRVILPLLQESAHGAAGVLDEEGRLAGMLTEREILRRMFATSADKTIHAANIRKYLDDMTVGDAMIASPETLDDDIAIEDAAGMMLRRGYRFMPVVSRYNREALLGIVSERELAAQLHVRLQETRRSEMEHKNVLAYLLREPYGAGYQSAS
jgi:CBS domain-containing protein